MAVIEKLPSLFIAAFLIASGVEAQSTPTFEDCLTDTSGQTSIGNKITTYELLCGDGAATPTLTITPNDVSFTKLCSLLSTGTITKTDGSTVNFKDALSSTTSKGLTLFAPTDAAFDSIGLDVVNALLDSTSTVSSIIRNDLIARWMELHVLPQSYLTSDFTCNENLLTLNPSGTVRGQQVQRTRCAGKAGSFNQIGGGNVGDATQPTVGAPLGVFDQTDFQNGSNPITMILTPNDANDGFETSSNLLTCNGVVHVVDVPLRPGRQSDYYGAKGGKGYTGFGTGYTGYGKSKASKYASILPPTTQTTGSVTLASWFGGGRMLGEEYEINDELMAEIDRDADRENRRSRLESLLVDANGNVESMD